MSEDKLLRLVKKSRFSPQAYGLVMAALELAVSGKRGHVSGVELLEALAILVARRFGLLARAVLNEWGIYRSEDVGEIVFDLVEAGIMAKRPQDSRQDFVGYPLFETVKRLLMEEPLGDIFMNESEERFGRGLPQQGEEP